MISPQLMLDGTLLHAYFQPYHVNISQGGRPPHTPVGTRASGELLTRPERIDSDIEAFFADLTLDQHFRIVEWQLSLGQSLHNLLNTHTAINLHNSIVQEEAGRAKLISMLHGITAPLTLEFTETFPMPSPEIANKLLRLLRKMGHQTALDDFGTGLNGMSLLTDYDFDLVKIDRSLTFDLAHRLEKKRMISLILKMLEVLGRDHVVEGIEEVEVYDFLLEIGYTQFQGFLFDAPQPLDQYIVAQQEMESRQT